MKFDLSFVGDAPVSAFMDWYQLTMLQAMRHQLDHSEGMHLRMAYTVRTKGANTARLRAGLEAALERLENVPVLLPHEAEQIPTRAPYMKPGFVQELKDVRLHPRDCVVVSERNGELDIAIQGGITTILFEQIILSIVSELWSQLRFPERAERERASAEGIQLLRGELAKIKDAAEKSSHPIRLIEGGTRRRFSLQHQLEVLSLLRREIPDQLFGTSNIHYALSRDVRLAGTQAHLFAMLFQQHGGPLHNFPARAMQAWVNEYRGNLGYMLPDVLTTEAWLRSVDLYFAKLFDGFRWDSGDPHRWTELVINRLQQLGINPATKFAVYSDGLTVDKMLSLWRRYEGNPWKTSYIIGTFLTNTVPGHQPLSQVIKLSHVNGQPVAKVSDEPEKATCPEPDFLATLKRTFSIR